MCLQSSRKCSTPFGINGTNSHLRLRVYKLFVIVLNAFRHQRNKQRITNHTIDMGVEGAQRLSASTEQTEWPACYPPLVPWCSTPFGINGTNSRQLVVLIPKRLVLNAFRHQRNKQSLAGRKPRQSFTSAQRLSASTEQTAQLIDLHPSTRPVLNAFRHQRNKQPP